ncbi:MAG: hypothetical protein LBH24_02920 [Clostridiales bacterium]|jgi:ribonuclease-3|nr:hypothetical protein [Clostridiales bacterium]
MSKRKSPLKTTLTDDERRLIEALIGYRFKNPARLNEALTHSSLKNEERSVTVDYERLEFLGDRVLNLAVAQRLYDSGRFTPGEMTEIMKGLVSETPFCAAAEKLGLSGFLLASRGVSENEKEKFSDKTKSDLFESLAAAVYLDSGRNLTAVEPMIDRYLGSVDTR